MPAKRPSAKQCHGGELAAGLRFDYNGDDSDMVISNSAAFFATALSDSDPALFASIDQETNRQQNQIELIASENIVSRAVLEAPGSSMTNKYAEG